MCGRVHQDDMQRAEKDLPADEHRPAAAARSSPAPIRASRLWEQTPAAYLWWASAVLGLCAVGDTLEALSPVHVGDVGSQTPHAGRALCKHRNGRWRGQKATRQTLSRFPRAHRCHSGAGALSGESGGGVEHFSDSGSRSTSAYAILPRVLSAHFTGVRSTIERRQGSSSRTVLEACAFDR